MPWHGKVTIFGAILVHYKKQTTWFITCPNYALPLPLCTNVLNSEGVGFTVSSQIQKFHVMCLDGEFYAVGCNFWLTVTSL